MDTVSVILPTYNERTAIISLLKRLHTEFHKLHQPYEVIVCDDCSQDGTADLVSSYANKHRDRVVRVIRRTQKPGLAFSIADGIRAATGPIIIGMDADGNHDPATIPSLLSHIQEAQLVVASRFIKGGGMSQKIRYYPTFLLNLFFSIVGMPVLDSTSGYYACRKSDLMRLNLPSIYYGYGDYHLRLVHYAKKKKYIILEVPTRYGNRIGGVSKSRLFSMLISYTKEVMRLQLE